MPSANVNSRESIAAVYPRDTFERDAAANATPVPEVRRGLKILSQPDAEGRFELMAAAEHVGERDPEGDAIFLAPHREENRDALTGGAAAANAAPLAGAAMPDQADQYEAFLTQVIEAARSAVFKSDIGRDRRLRGFHGG